jgi:hypothetical protein
LTKRNAHFKKKALFLFAILTGLIRYRL